MLNYPANMKFDSRRSVMVSKNGMVATSQPLAAMAGIEILQQGGNAADAAVATAAAMNVTEPVTTGIGGDCFVLYYDAVSKKVHALNSSGRSPQKLTLERIRQDVDEENWDFHPHTITAPGAVAGWFEVVEKFGSKQMAGILTPAIRLAEEGFPVAPITAHFWDISVSRQLIHAPNGMEMTIDGSAPKPGEIWQNQGLAKAFRRIAEYGKDGFYQGPIAEAIAEVVQSRGGLLSVEDLANHTSEWMDPISTTYRGYRVWECPPNGQGVAALLALNILENFEVADQDPLGVDRLHLMIEAMRLAFADTRWFVADPNTDPAPLQELLSKSYASERAKLISLEKATLDQLRGTPTSSSDTIYLTVVDKFGNACSFIASNYMGMGTGFVPKGWGFTLQNRGRGFSLDADHPNRFAPGKRPYHTIIPSMITHEDTGELFASYGVMGGYMQPQGHMQAVVNLIEDGLDPQKALDRRRFCIGDGQAGGIVSLEDGIPIAVMSDLVTRGHKTQPLSGHRRSLFGRGQIILRDRQSGVLWGGSDPRADGVALGY